MEAREIQNPTRHCFHGQNRGNKKHVGLNYEKTLYVNENKENVKKLGKMNFSRNVVGNFSILRKYGGSSNFRVNG